MKILKKNYKWLLCLIMLYLSIQINGTKAVPTPKISITSIEGSLGHAGTQNDPFVCYTPLNNPDEKITFRWTYTTGFCSEYKITYQITGHIETNAYHDDHVAKYASEVATKVGNHEYNITVRLYTKRTPWDELKLVASDTETFWVSKKDASITILLDNYDYVRFPGPNYKGTFKFYVGSSDYIEVFTEDHSTPSMTLYAGRDYTPFKTNTLSIKYDKFDGKPLSNHGNKRWTYWLHKITLKNYVGGVLTDQETKTFYMSYNYARISIILVAFNPGKWDIYTSPWWFCTFKFYINGEYVGSETCIKNKLKSLDTTKFVWDSDSERDDGKDATWIHRYSLPIIEVYSKYTTEKRYFGIYLYYSRYGNMHIDFNDPDIGVNELFSGSNPTGVLSTNGPSYNTIYDFGFYTYSFIHNDFGTYMQFNMKIYDLSLFDLTTKSPK